MLKLGKYKHYKGKDYEVIGVAKLEATLEDMVVYRPLYKQSLKLRRASEEENKFSSSLTPSNYSSEYSLWVRPLNVFTENVEIDGKVTPRFEYIGE